MPAPLPPITDRGRDVATTGRRQASGGYAALSTIALLCLAAALSLTAVVRAVVTHQRVQGHALRHAVAFEAAEAGLDWALSQLDDPLAIDAACNRVAASALSRSFLQTYLVVATSNRSVTALSAHDASGARVPLQPTCTRASPDTPSGPAWQCQCPSDGHLGTAATSGSDAALHPSFSVRFEAASAPGALQIVATGCTQAGGACALSGGRVDAVAQVRSVHAILPTLAMLPSAALTALGDVRSSAALEVRNADAWSGGTAVQAGGAVDLPHAVIGAPDGASPDPAVQSFDSGLSATTGDHLFLQLFDLDRRAWQRLTAVRPVVCAAPVTCAAALSAAAATVPGPVSLRIDGDAAIVGPLALGSVDRPVLLVVAGRLTVSGDVHVSGLIEAQGIVWNHAPTSADDGGVTGALVSEGTYGGTGAPRFAYDLGILQHLRAAGQVVRLPGGWRDF